MNSVIKLENVSKHYGSFVAVDNLNLEIERGEIFGLLGPNGAGKSTSILMMLGLTDPTSGTVSVLGMDATKDPVSVKRKVGYMPENVGFYNDMTGFDNLLLTAQLNAIPKSEAKQRIKEALGHVGLEEKANMKVSKYSKGMKQRLGLADILVKRSEIIILDEPINGIDPVGVNELLKLIRDLCDKYKMTALISSHNLHQMQAFCDRVGLFVEGKLIAHGPVGGLAEQLFSEDLHSVCFELENEFYVENKSKNKNKVEKLLASIDGVKDIFLEGRVFRLVSHREIIDEVSRVFYDNGIRFMSLSYRQIGLDEIYSRYFEGGN